MEYTFEITEENAGERTDKFLSTAIEDISRSSIASLCEDGMVLSGGKAVGKNYKLRVGDIITVTVPEPKEYEAGAENIPLEIVFEDEHLLVVNKPKGMVVHPAPGN